MWNQNGSRFRKIDKKTKISWKWAWKIEQLNLHYTNPHQKKNYSSTIDKDIRFKIYSRVKVNAGQIQWNFSFLVVNLKTNYQNFLSILLRRMRDFPSFFLEFWIRGERGRTENSLYNKDFNQEGYWKIKGTNMMTSFQIEMLWMLNIHEENITKGKNRKPFLLSTISYISEEGRP